MLIEKIKINDRGLSLPQRIRKNFCHGETLNLVILSDTLIIQKMPEKQFYSPEQRKQMIEHQIIATIKIVK